MMHTRYILIKIVHTRPYVWLYSLEWIILIMKQWELENNQLYVEKTDISM